MTDLFNIQIPIMPVAKGSMRAIIPRHSMRPVVICSNRPQLTQYESVLRDHFQRAMHEIAPTSGAIAIELSFARLRPKTRNRKREHWIVTRPDLDKLIRAVLDAMTGIVFVDDSQVAYITAKKHYAESQSISIRVSILNMIEGEQHEDRAD